MSNIPYGGNAKQAKPVLEGNGDVWMNLYNGYLGNSDAVNPSNGMPIITLADLRNLFNLLNERIAAINALMALFDAKYKDLMNEEALLKNILNTFDMATVMNGIAEGKALANRALQVALAAQATANAVSDTANSAKSLAQDADQKASSADDKATGALDAAQNAQIAAQAAQAAYQTAIQQSNDAMTVAQFQMVLRSTTTDFPRLPTPQEFALAHGGPIYGSNMSYTGLVQTLIIHPGEDSWQVLGVAAATASSVYDAIKNFGGTGTGTSGPDYFTNSQVTSLTPQSYGPTTGYGAVINGIDALGNPQASGIIRIGMIRFSKAAMD